MMAALRPQSFRVLRADAACRSFTFGRVTYKRARLQLKARKRYFATGAPQTESSKSTPSSSSSDIASASSASSDIAKTSSTNSHDPKDNATGALGWENSTDYNISAFSQLPYRHFGFNQHMLVNAEFKEALRQVLWQFRAPIRYAFAYGSGVFPQSRKIPDTLPPSPHPHPPEAVTKWQASGGKNIDFIFGVSYTQHWHSLNLHQHRDHYSFLGSLGSGVIKRVQDHWGAGAYFNTYITINGISVKYAVVNLDTLYRDLSDWTTLYLAGRLQKPVKILRDDPRIRLANQVNLISALRTALLMLPDTFTERDLYFKIAGLSYIGDPRMRFRAERPDKVYAIVDSQMASFRALYYPLVSDLPNVNFAGQEASRPGSWMDDSDANHTLMQDMDPVRRGNMVCRLPGSFRRKLYTASFGMFDGSQSEFSELVAEPDKKKDTAAHEEATFARQRSGSEFDRRIAISEGLPDTLKATVRKTTTRPAVTQSFKGILTTGPVKSWKYVMEKRAKGRMKEEKSKELEGEQAKGDDAEDKK